MTFQRSIEEVKKAEKNRKLAIATGVGIALILACIFPPLIAIGVVVAYGAVVVYFTCKVIVDILT